MRIFTYKAIYVIVSLTLLHSPDEILSCSHYFITHKAKVQRHFFINATSEAMIFLNRKMISQIIKEFIFIVFVFISAKIFERECIYSYYYIIAINSNNNWNTYIHTLMLENL